MSWRKKRWQLSDNKLITALDKKQVQEMDETVLTSGLDDKGAIAATTTDLKHSSIVSGILSDLEATHTSAAAANRLRVGFW